MPARWCQFVIAVPALSSRFIESMRRHRRDPKYADDADAVAFFDELIADALAIVFVEPFILLILGHFLFKNAIGPRRIAAAVVGGTSLAGGVGTVYGAIIGALILTSLQTGMVLIGFGDGSYQRIVIGIALVLAVWLDIVYRKRIK